MNSLTQDYPSVLLGDHPPPCLSLYQPTHRQHPDNVQDPIRFRNLLKKIEESLHQQYLSHDIRALLRPFEALAEDRAFWNHTADVANAAVAGRIETLLIEADRLIPGAIDVARGAITPGDLGDPQIDDVLDDLGERVLKTGGEVVIVPAERMPTQTGAAAIYRF